MPRSDGFRKYVEAGAVLGQITRARAEEIAKELVGNGEIQRAQAQQWVDDLLEWSRKASEELIALVRSEVTAQLHSLGLDPEDLAKQVADVLKYSAAAGRRATEDVAMTATATVGKTATAAKKAAARAAPTATATVGKTATAAKKAAAKAATRVPKPAAARRPATKTAAKKTAAKKAPAKKAAPGKKAAQATKTAAKKAPAKKAPGTEATATHTTAAKKASH